MSGFDPFGAIGARVFAGAALVLLLVSAGLGLTLRAEHQRAQAWEARSGLEASNHRQTKANYRLAQAQAEKLEAQRIASAEARHREINHATSTDHARRLADLRARYQRLLDGARRAAPRSATGNVAVPGLPDAAGRTDEAADARLAGAAGAGLAADERLIGAEQALQLDVLIEWIETQAAAARQASVDQQRNPEDGRSTDHQHPSRAAMARRVEHDSHRGQHETGK